MNQPTCRVCFEEESPEQDLVSPCSCSGSVKYIHKECLRKELDARERIGLQIQTCTICRSPYHWIPFEDETKYPFITVPLLTAFISHYGHQDPAIRVIFLLIIAVNWIFMYPWFRVHTRRESRVVARWILRLTLGCMILGRIIPIAHVLSWIYAALSFCFLIWQTGVRMTPLRIATYTVGTLEASIILYRVQELNMPSGLDILFVSLLTVPTYLVSTIEVE